MNRPRNRQPKPQRGGSGGGGGRGDGGRGHGGGSRGGFSRPEYHPVPSIRQVVPGASVSIVLKQDQATGREVQGTVAELLTRGDHPRGIKVRLSDGRVGRVQRMVQTDGSFVPNSQPSTTRQVQDRAPTMPSQDGPPPRTLADFIPVDPEEDVTPSSNVDYTFSTATAKCPFCEFQGDELAVSRHVDEHLT